MRFYQQAEGESANGGTYLLTIALVIMSLVVGQLLSEFLSMRFLGHSLIYLPENYNQNAVLCLLLLPFMCAVSSLLLSLKYIHKRSLLSVFTTRKQIDFKRVFFSAGLWTMVLVGMSLVSIGLGADIQWKGISKETLLLFLIVLVLLPFQTLAEDLFFRSFLFQGLSRLKVNPYITIISIGTLFGLAHWGNPEVSLLGEQLLFYYIATGIFMALLVHWDNGMELSIGFHFANNLFSAFVLTNNWQVFQSDALFIDKTPPSFSWLDMGVILVLQLALLFVFKVVYKWGKVRPIL